MYWIKKLPTNGKQRVVSYENLVFTDRKPIDVAIDTVKHIAEKYPAPYTLFASGGIDSQSCICAWLQSGVDFEVVFVRYENDFNIHDFAELELMQKQYGFKIKILDFIIRNGILEALENKIATVQNLDSFRSEYDGYDFFNSSPIEGLKFFVEKNDETDENIKLFFYDIVWKFDCFFH